MSIDSFLLEKNNLSVSIPMSTTTKKPKGRPTKYKADYDDIAYGACLLGATDGKLAEIFGVNEDTVNERKKKFPSFS